MSVLDIIICILDISLCTSIIVGAVFYYKLSKKHEEEVGMLKAQIANMQQRWIWLEERYAKHEAKYHR
jgi:Na+-transporting NADH:ubiquinone oxidoreductase subunit NqrC